MLKYKITQIKEECKIKLEYMGLWELCVLGSFTDIVNISYC